LTLNQRETAESEEEKKYNERIYSQQKEEEKKSNQNPSNDSMIDICGFMNETDEYGSTLDNEQPKKAFQLDFELEDQIIQKN
jgi:hypothetical protein